MKRIGNLYPKIYNINNLKLADLKARRGKTNKKDIINHDINEEANIINLYHLLVNREYKTSSYDVFTLYEGKEREIYKLPYYPDRILHHGIMNILEPLFIKIFIKNTYNCIKNRGIHKAQKDVIEALKDKNNTRYCLKLDIKKFYPNINHIILKKLLRKKFKDNDLLNLLDEIIDSAKGVPIGNYLSQYLANFYLCYFDHWIKEDKKVKYYFRYCDDIIIFSDNKLSLHSLLIDIKEYININLKLELKSNYQIFPLAKRNLDFVGYVFNHNYVNLRKSIKIKFIRMLKYNRNTKSIASYNGWLIHCNSINLMKKYLKNE